MNLFNLPNAFKFVFVSWLVLISGCGSLSAQSELKPVLSGDRVILVGNESLHAYRDNPLTAQVVGAVLQVVELTPSEIVVKDRRGMAVVARKDLILVRQSDPLGQIERRVASKHRPFAKAQLEDLRNLSQGFEALAKVWDRQQSHDWCRLRMVEELLAFGERDQAYELLIGFQKDSPVWPVAQAIKASLEGNAADKLTQIIEQHPKCCVAYQLLVNHYLDQVQQTLLKEKFDRSQLERDCRLALAIITQMESALPERTEAVTLRARLCSVAWQADIPVAASYSKETVRLGYRAMTQDPYDMVLMVELTTCLFANRQYDESAQLALKVAKRFPRNIRPLQRLLTIAVRIPDKAKELPFSERTTTELLAKDWSAIFDGVEKTFDLDIGLKQVADHAMPINVASGNGRRESGALLHSESKQSALEILCADDNSEYLKFINTNTTGIDFDRLSEQQSIKLVKVCVQNDSVHAMKFLQELNLLKRLPATARNLVVQEAIERKAFGCAFVLANSSWDLSPKNLGDLADLLKCEVHDLESSLETKLMAHAIDDAVSSMSRYAPPLEKNIEGLKLANEQIADLRREQHRQPDYYHRPAAPVFVPTQHVYSGTTDAERGVRLRQAIQRDLDSYTYQDDDSTDSFYGQLLKEALGFRDQFNSAISYFKRQLLADSERHLARLEMVAGKSLKKTWHDQLRQKLTE